MTARPALASPAAHRHDQPMPLFAELVVPDEVVIGFFSAVVLGLCTAVAVLWRKLNGRK